MQPSRTHALPPRVYFLSTFLVAIGAFYAFNRFDIDENLFYLPVFVLAAIYALFNFRLQKQPNTYFTTNKKIKLSLLARKVLARYLVWLAIIASAKWFYASLPFFTTPFFNKAHLFFEQFIVLYLILGIPYFALTLIYKHSREEDFYDPAVRLLHLLKQAYLALDAKRGNKYFLRAIKKQYNRKVLLIFLMRCYFIPGMIVQVYFNIFGAIEFIDNSFYDYQFLAFLYFTAAIFWLMDTLNASVAYTFESRWTESRTRSIDLTIGGWLACFCCYPPLNQATGFLFPWAPDVESDFAKDLVAGDLTTLYVIKSIELLVLMLHIFTTVSLGPSIANISLRKLQTRGTYAIVRHPGTTLKLLFFALQSMVYKQFWQLKFIYGYIMWGIIYILRALTEERHLVHFKEYQEYKKKVKYRFIPWLF